MDKPHIRPTSSRPYLENLISPNWFADGPEGIQKLLAVEDEYFALAPKDSELGLRLDRMLDELPDPERTCVERAVLEQATYVQIAEGFGWATASGEPDRKRAWRICQRGLKMLFERIREEGL